MLIEDRMMNTELSASGGTSVAVDISGKYACSPRIKRRFRPGSEKRAWKRPETEYCHSVTATTERLAERENHHTTAT